MEFSFNEVRIVRTTRGAFAQVHGTEEETVLLRLVKSHPQSFFEYVLEYAQQGDRKFTTMRLWGKRVIKFVVEYNIQTLVLEKVAFVLEDESEIILSSDKNTFEEKENLKIANLAVDGTLITFTPEKEISFE